VEHIARHLGTGAVGNIGGGQATSCSLFEAIDRCEHIAGVELAWEYVDQERAGDHRSSI